MPDIHIMEVTLRDGLQNEKFILPLADKQSLLGQLLAAGFTDIEAGAFVHPKLVPQMADTAQLFAQLPPAEKARYFALIPNRKGYDLAFQAGCRHMAYVLSVTETMNQRNVNMSVEEGYRQAVDIIRQAQADGVQLRMYLAVVFHCPFEGRTPIETAMRWVGAFANEPIADLCLADTDGNALPGQVSQVSRAALQQLAQAGSSASLSLHLHNTYGRAEENLRAALKAGVRHFDSATAGLGGCPFAPGAKGNIATEELVRICEQEGFRTGIEASLLAQTANWLRQTREAHLEQAQAEK